MAELNPTWIYLEAGTIQWAKENCELYPLQREIEKD